MNSDDARARPMLEFADFRLDARRRQVTRRTTGQAIPLSGVQFDTLLMLVVNAGDVVGKAALLAQVWPHVTVVENSVNQCIASLRRALGDDAASPRFIGTVPGRGYRFLAAVSSPSGQAHDPVAWQHYVAGWSALTRPGSFTLETARVHLEAAVARDPSIAIAHVALAECLGLMVAHGLRTIPEIAEPMYLAATHALALAPGLPEAHAMVGRVVGGLGNAAVVSEGYARAFELNPNCYSALKWLGADLMATGRFEEALTLFRRAQAVEPLAVNIHSHVAMAFFFQGRYAEAAEQLEFTLKLDETFETAHLMMGRTLLELAAYERAIDHLRRGGPNGLAAMPLALVRLGRAEEVRAGLATLLAQKDPPPRPVQIILAQVALGEHEAALDEIVRGIGAWAMAPFMGVDPTFKPVLALPHAAQRLEQATADLVRQSREEFAARGWPENPWAAA